MAEINCRRSTSTLCRKASLWWRHFLKLAVNVVKRRIRSFQSLWKELSNTQDGGRDGSVLIEKKL
jgi:hypothetical protein